MNQNTAVSLNNISKKYLLFNKPQDRLYQLLFSRLGKNYARSFWALQNISLEIERGKTLGIIGRNGSGKSTLLQIVAGILQPTSGQVAVNGRSTALLELGAGFNPEFSGRENLFINGAILGIDRSEMKNRLDDILDFAQIGDYIDQPVKFYSSGMFVRLAFSIAINLDPDVLIVDEALAVGDAGFVLKCMKKIRELRSRGTTILLVTHDVQTVRMLCDTAIWLHEGQMQMAGEPLDVTSEYVQFLLSNETTTAALRRGGESAALSSSFNQNPPVESLDLRDDLVRWGSQQLRIASVNITSDIPASTDIIFEHGHPLKIEVVVEALETTSSAHLGVGMAFRNIRGLDILTSTTYDRGNPLPPLAKGQSAKVTFRLNNILAPGDYALVVNIEDRTSGLPQYLDFIENAVIFKVVTQIPVFSLVLPEVDQTIAIQ